MWEIIKKIWQKSWWSKTLLVIGAIFVWPFTLGVGASLLLLKMVKNPLIKWVAVLPILLFSLANSAYWVSSIVSPSPVQKEDQKTTAVMSQQPVSSPAAQIKQNELSQQIQTPKTTPPPSPKPAPVATEPAMAITEPSPEPTPPPPTPAPAPTPTDQTPSVAPEPLFDKNRGNNYVAAKYAQEIMNTGNKAVPGTITDTYLELYPESTNGKDEEAYRKSGISAFLTVEINNLDWNSFDESSKKDIAASLVTAMGNIFSRLGSHVYVNNGIRRVAEGGYGWFSTEPEITLK